MRKEILLAIVIGLLVGLVLTYGIYLARTALRHPNNTELQTQSTLTASPEPSTLGTLTIVNPSDELVQTEQDLTIAGTTIANSFVIIFVNNEETITTADSSGNFSIEAELEVGSNIITVIAVDEDGKESTAERTVIVIANETTDTATVSARTTR